MFLSIGIMFTVAFCIFTIGTVLVLRSRGNPEPSDTGAIFQASGGTAGLALISLMASILFAVDK